jgi:hypothetical protein
VMSNSQGRSVDRCCGLAAGASPPPAMRFPLNSAARPGRSSRTRL